MSHPYEPDRPRSARGEWRRREARRKRYVRRRIVALVGALLLLAALGFGIRALVLRWRGPGPTPPSPSGQTTAPSVPIPFKPDRLLEGPDLDGDGRPERVAVAPAVMGTTEVGLVTGPAGKERLIGQVISLPEAPLEIADLPGAPGVLLWNGALPRRGEPVAVDVGGAPALEAQGGEPDRKAWRLDPAAGLVPVDYYAAAAPLTPPEPTMILIDKGLNVLWYYEEGKLVQTSRVATGRHIEGPAPTRANRMQNYITPTGRYTATLMAPGLPYYKENIPALAPENPLGTRWIGFDAYEGDNGTVWAIHGTNDPGSIGQWASDSCIRMHNAEVEALYEAVALGTPIIIQNSLAGTP